ncbi:hypothetical protein GCM10009639_16410 [Kitasatospora putterlickiae]|uniref:Peptide deformylase n=1 Tax=Kitasatospora putterlickiae TaxID=221725 RepID=A0ABN1XSK6_9ACTN
MPDSRPASASSGNNRVTAATGRVPIEGHGYFARCLQHETDHLAGGLYIDRLAARGRRTALRRMAERQAEVFAKRAARAEELAALRRA